MAARDHQRRRPAARAGLPPYPTAESCGVRAEHCAQPRLGRAESATGTAAGVQLHSCAGHPAPGYRKDLAAREPRLLVRPRDARAPCRGVADAWHERQARAGHGCSRAPRKEEDIMSASPPLLRVAAVLAISIACTGCSKEPPGTWQGYVEGEFLYLASSQAGQLTTLGIARADRRGQRAALHARSTERNRSCRTGA